jgi:hypothetical protein
MKQAESGVVGIAMQQFVEQSEFCVHLGLQARAFVESYVVHVKPSQHERAPPHVSPSPAHLQRSASAQKPLAGMFVKGMQQPVSQSAADVQGFRQPA